jgi:hypothetical protein
MHDGITKERHERSIGSKENNKKLKKMRCASSSNKRQKSIVACEFPVSIPSRHLAAADALMNEKNNFFNEIHPFIHQPSSIFTTMQRSINRCTINSISQQIC